MATGDRIDAIARELGATSRGLQREVKDRLEVYARQVDGLLVRIAAAELTIAKLEARLATAERRAPPALVRNVNAA